MKTKQTLLAILFLILTTVVSNAQPCKTVKVGMTTSEVLKVAGTPKGIVNLGVDNKTDSMFSWYYGKQEVWFEKNKVTYLSADYIKTGDAARKFADKKITHKEFQKMLDRINEEECK